MSLTHAKLSEVVLKKLCNMQGIPDLPVGKGVEVKMKMKMEMEMKRVRMVTKMNQLCSISLIYLKINNSNDFNSIYKYSLFAQFF